jgi:hypothetical protein
MLRKYLSLPLLVRLFVSDSAGRVDFPRTKVGSLRGGIDSSRVQVKALENELLVVQLAKREAHNLVDIRYRRSSIEKALYVSGWTDQGRRGRKEEQTSYGFLSTCDALDTQASDILSLSCGPSSPITAIGNLCLWEYVL